MPTVLPTLNRLAHIARWSMMRIRVVKEPTMLMRRALHFDSTALTASMITLVIFGTELFFYHRWKLGPCICHLCVSTLVQATVVSPGDLVLRVLTIDLPGLSTILRLQVSLVCILFFVEESLLWRTLRCLSSLWCLSFSDLHDLF